VQGHPVLPTGRGRVLIPGGHRAIHRRFHAHENRWAFPRIWVARNPTFHPTNPFLGARWLRMAALGCRNDPRGPDVLRCNDPFRPLKVATRVRIPLGLPFLIWSRPIRDGCLDLPDDDKELVELGDPSGAQLLPSSGLTSLRSAMGTSIPSTSTAWDRTTRSA